MKITEDELSRLVHDFRAPARHVRQFANILQRDVDKYADKDLNDLVENLLQRSLLLEAMIDGLGGIGKILVQKVNPTSIDVGQLLSSIATSFELEAVLDAVADRSNTVQFDRTLLVLALTEIVKNAQTHGNSSSLEVSLATTETDAVRLLIANSVENAPKINSSLTMPFTNTDNTLSPDSTGVGLARARAALARGGGDLQVHFEDNTRFVATLNLKSAVD